MRREAPSAFRRSRLKWGAAVGLVAGASALFAAGIWFLRVPIADLSLRSALSQRGIEGDFQVVNLDWDGALITGVRIGPEPLPDAHIQAISVQFRWAGPFPSLDSVRLVEPRLRLTMDEAGRVSAGALDRFGGAGDGGRPSLPAMRLDIERGQALVQAPFGAVTAYFQSQGRLGENFSGAARIEPTTRPGEAYALQNGQASLVAASQDGTLSVRLTASAERLVWAGAALRGIEFNADAGAPLDLARADLEARWRLGGVENGPAGLSATGFAGRLTAGGALNADRLAPGEWLGAAEADAARLSLADIALTGARFQANLVGANDSGRGEWRLDAQRFAGVAMTSAAPAAIGAFDFDLTGEEEFNVEAGIALARARLDAGAQAEVRAMLPDIAGAPFGPAVSAAERALDAGFDNFDLTAPIRLHWRGDEGRLVAPAPIEARAPNGLLVRITPARENAAALSVTLPSGAVRGALRADMSGAGAPDTALAIEDLRWAPDAAFEARGKLSIPDWRGAQSHFSAPNLDLTVMASPQAEGRFTLAGPMTMTGPVGDGVARDLALDLDLTATWGQGWRLTQADNCVPVRMAGLDVAGLSFQAGGFSLCSVGDALIAANAQDALSGGFVIDALRFDGRLSGESGEPARLRVNSVRGAFSGTLDNMLLAIVADAPALAVDFAPDRTLSIAGERLTADTRLANDTWRTEGVFEAGALTDPSLPGDVSAIGGRWSAAPEGDAAVIRVAAGEARIVARTPAADAADDRPLFTPMRILGAEAVLREGAVTAEGSIALERGVRQLARFSAEHDLESGAGTARVFADEIVFSEALQPYEITELARGLVENVRGPAAASADFAWTQDGALTARGRVRLDGVSLAMATIPVIENVRGEIVFDDLFAMTTPPGQTLTIGELNPGVSVRDGALRFQLLSESRVAIEQATFDFASGVLAVDPTQITLGAEETRFRLTLSNVDVEALVAQLNMPDLRATGRVEGSFPILLTPRTAFIENGELRAAPGGGTIAYVGEAGADVTGAARVAFDALRSFHYDDLRLVLNGDLSGDVVTQVNFTGENTGRPVDLTPLADVPGVGQVNARGVPFLFRVSVTAPFRQLAENAPGAVNARDVVEREIQQQQETQQSDQNDETEAEPPASVDVQVPPLR